jgi:hypothetical protein
MVMCATVVFPGTSLAVAHHWLPRVLWQVGLGCHVYVDGWWVLCCSCGTLMLHSCRQAQAACSLHACNFSASSMLRNTAICMKQRGVRTAGAL